MKYNYLPSKVDFEQKENEVRVWKKEDLEIFDTCSFLKIQDLHMKNGIIEVEVKSSFLEEAPDYARGFIGIAFHIREDNELFECFYIRPSNGRECTDPIRHNRAVQYFQYPDHPFSWYRERGIQAAENSADIAMEEWISLKIVIRDGTGVLYINGEKALEVLLELGGTAGSIGLFVDIGTDGRFRNLNITQLDS